MAELVQEERFARSLRSGLATIRQAATVHPISALQTEYSLGSQKQRFCPPAARDWLCTYSPLGGFLTGKIKSLDALSEGDYR